MNALGTGGHEVYSHHQYECPGPHAAYRIYQQQCRRFFSKAPIAATSFTTPEVSLWVTSTACGRPSLQSRLHFFISTASPQGNPLAPPRPHTAGNGSKTLTKLSRYQG